MPFPTPNPFRAAALAIAACTALAAAAQQPAPLKTALDPTFAPQAMIKLGGGMQGFNVELGEELAKRLGRKLDIEATEFSGLVPGLNSGKYDFLLAPVTVTPERAKALLFTEGYTETNYTFLGRKNAPKLETLEALKGKVVAVNKGSNYEGWAKDNAEKYGFKYDVYGTNADAIQAVMSSRADYNLAGNTVVGWAAKQNAALQTGYTVKTGLVWAIPFRLNDKAGRDAASNALKCMKLDGTIAKMATRWYGIEPAAGSVEKTVAAGHGVPGTENYDATPITPKCS
ncbi:transporter substrate-binding domain-containing protein [Variovorax ginsengisoli]|uniref:Transporter substrate-binding domain-containing protein n=1 Tax=Variovorax ginsengisoli TaxID=363844 RepID=A0ABT8SDV9_9BURK|nr:transporter substrate-binding domain-containing protein [Variovorax ginsengisoli]MDN8617921.1 transporter substrate-binding domain-containing protein [Variovorax ginsengisoli]MDO1537091.1 transporter substrate-binding domain-containing protein [Variovorax ginsengisoli]